MEIHLSVLIRQEEGGMWFAQCLEHDIAAQGKTLAEVQSRLSLTVMGQIVIDIIHDEEPLANIDPAPENFREEFGKGLKVESHFAEPIATDFPLAKTSARIFA